ncbi:hypothetical protein ACTXT7_002684 [Hymenolepis weldensis]
MAEFEFTLKEATKCSSWVFRKARTDLFWKECNSYAYKHSPFNGPRQSSAAGMKDQKIKVKYISMEKWTNVKEEVTHSRLCIKTFVKYRDKSLSFYDCATLCNRHHQ